MIIVDIHEPRYIIERLRGKGIPITINKLSIGDYIITNIGVERKTIRDFYKSIIDKRLFDQLNRLKEAYDKTLLLLEGRIEDEIIDERESNVFRGGILYVAIDMNTPIIYTSDMDETISYIYGLWRRIYLKGRGKTSVLRYKPKIMDTNTRLKYILMGFPGVGEKLAENILKHYRTLKGFANTTLSELQEIEGIGERKAEEIFKLLNYRFERR